MVAWLVLVGCLSAPTSTSVFPLGEAGTLLLPAELKYIKDYEPLPENLSRSSVYQFRDRALLLINLSKPDGAPCSIDREVQQYEEAKKSPNFDVLYQRSVAERRKVGSYAAFYTEGGARSADEAKAGKPFHRAASYSICLGRSLLNVVAMNPVGDLADPDRATLDQIVASLVH